MRKLLFSIIALLTCAATMPSLVAQATTTESCSLRAEPMAVPVAEANDVSILPAASSSGRYVTFTSYATNLLSSVTDANQQSDIFMTDRVDDSIVRVSHNYATGEESNAGSSASAISSNGRYITFFSGADNLLEASDGNDAYDIFQFDVGRAVMERASVSSSEAEANGHSLNPSISGNGQRIAFVSYATNLVAGDTNEWGDIFVRDLSSGQTIRASVSTSGTESNGDSSEPAISSDGRYVAFSSYASNLVGSDGNSRQDVFVRDLQTNQTNRVSVSSSGTEADEASGEPTISSTGRYVAFHSLASNLDSNFTDDNDTYDVFIRDRVANTTKLISKKYQDTRTGNGESSFPSISANGQYVAYQSFATDLWPGGDQNVYWDIYEYDRVTDAMAGRISVGPEDVWPNGNSTRPAISGDSVFVAYESAATNLVEPNDTLQISDVFTHEWVDALGRPRTQCETKKKSETKTVMAPYAPSGPPLPKPPYDEDCQDIVDSPPGPDTNNTTGDYVVHKTAGVDDVFSGVYNPSIGGEETVYLRWGRVEETITDWDGWGYRKIKAKHGWGPSVKANVALTLQTDDDPSGGPTSFRYEMTYQGEGTECVRVVLVEYKIQEWETVPKHIFNSWAATP
jgi:hypothetical protein